MRPFCINSDNKTVVEPNSWDISRFWNTWTSRSGTAPVTMPCFKVGGHKHSAIDFSASGQTKRWASADCSKKQELAQLRVCFGFSLNMSGLVASEIDLACWSCMYKVWVASNEVSEKPPCLLSYQITYQLSNSSDLRQRPGQTCDC